MTADVWRCLEQAPREDSRFGWRGRLGARFELVGSLCLSPSSRKAGAVRCPRCSCNHRVVQGPRGPRAVCECDVDSCPDMLLDPYDLEVWTLDVRRLGGKVAKALELAPRPAPMLADWTVQIGCLEPNAVPVVVTLQNSSDAFRRAVFEVSAQLAGPFALLSPTMAHCTGQTMSLLSSRKAVFRDMASHLDVLPSGIVSSRAQGAELFSELHRAEVASDNEARRVFAVLTSSRARAQRRHRCMRCSRRWCSSGCRFARRPSGAGVRPRLSSSEGGSWRDDLG